MGTYARNLVPGPAPDASVPLRRSPPRHGACTRVHHRAGIPGQGSMRRPSGLIGAPIRPPQAALWGHRTQTWASPAPRAACACTTGAPHRAAIPVCAVLVR